MWIIPSGSLTKFMNFILLSCYMFTIGGLSSLHAHEIHLADGSVIETSQVWREKDFVLYEKFDTVVRIPTEKVIEVVYDDREVFKSVSIYFKNGTFVFCKYAWKKDGQVYCRQERSEYFYDLSDVAGVLKGRTHQFEELPVDVQKKFLFPTIYFSEENYLKVNYIWTDGQHLHFEIEDENYVVPIREVCTIKIGNTEYKSSSQTCTQKQNVDKTLIRNRNSGSNDAVDQTMVPIGKTKK
jgi:hypothetical protein